MEEQGNATMWIEPELSNEQTNCNSRKMAWFLLGLGVGAGVMLLAVHKDQARNLANVAASRVKLKINPNTI
jgi:hypothetical protein